MYFDFIQLTFVRFVKQRIPVDSNDSYKLNPTFMFDDNTIYFSF